MPAMSRDEYESELTGSRADIAAVLHGVADGIRTGRVRLGDDADAVTATVPDDLSLEIELETEADEVELELELEWAAPTDEPAVAPAGDISAGDESQPSGTDDGPADVELADGGPADGSAADGAAADERATETDADATETDADAAADGVTDETVDADGGADEVADVPVGDADADGVVAPEQVGPALAGAADGSQSLARFELFRDRADEWRWRLRHRNGNVIATSGEGYTRKHNARKGLRSVIANAPGADVSETD